MKKNIARFFVGLLVVVFALGAVGPAFASPNDPPEPIVYPACLATASALTGPAPLTVQFVAHSNNESVAYAWFFGGGEKASGTGNVVSNKYSGVGEYRVRLVCEDGTRGFYNHANLLIITVTPGEDSTIQKPEDNDDSDNEQNQPADSGSVTTSATGSIIGDNNIAPVINGDNNKVIIKIAEPAPVVEETIEPKPLTFGQKFWLPWKTFWRGVVAIIVGWFDLNIP